MAYYSDSFMGIQVGPLPTLGAQEGEGSHLRVPSSTLMPSGRYLRALKYLNGPLGGTRKWAPPPREGRGPT